MAHSDFKFPRDADWVFSHNFWDGEDSSCAYFGNLEYCLNLASGWIEHEGRSLKDVEAECLKNGKASGELWAVYIDPDFIEEGSDLEGGCDA